MNKITDVLTNSVIALVVIMTVSVSQTQPASAQCANLGDDAMPAEVRSCVRHLVENSISRCKLEIDAVYSTQCKWQKDLGDIPVSTGFTSARGGWSGWSDWIVSSAWDGGNNGCIRARLYCE